MYSLYDAINEELDEEKPVNLKHALTETIANILDAYGGGEDVIIQTQQASVDFKYYVRTHQYKLYSTNLLYNHGIAQAIWNAMGKLDGCGKYKTLLMHYALENFIQKFIERNAIMTIPFANSGRRWMTITMRVTGEDDPNIIESITSIVNEFDNESFWKTYAKPVRMLEKILNTETGFRDILQNRNQDKNGVSIPVSFYIDPLFLTLTILY